MTMFGHHCGALEMFVTLTQEGLWWQKWILLKKVKYKYLCNNEANNKWDIILNESILLLSVLSTNYLQKHTE